MSPKFAYVGCFTTVARKARGKGVAVYRIDPATAAWSFVEACDVAPNPHFVALHPTQRFLYSAHGDSSEVCAYARDPQTGRLRFLNKQDTHGDNSSTAVVDSSGRWLLLTTGPGVALFPVNPDGSLAPFTENIVPQHDAGAHPHPHQAIFDPTEQFVVVPDKGLNQVHVFRFDAARGKLVACDPPFTKTRSGAVPRHVVFHPHRPYAYLVNEADSTVNAYHWDAARGQLKAFQRVGTTPDTYVGDNSGAEIAILPSGKFVYASNRGHDSVVIYAVDEATGRIEAVGWESTQGKKPRFFGLNPDCSRLYAANEDGHTIVEFTIDPATGKLAPTGQIVETGSPASIAFATV
jgi:6-phosphogluconolactonase (cycloisomerase 2 family)